MHTPLRENLITVEEKKNKEKKRQYLSLLNEKFSKISNTFTPYSSKVF
jgi:hypothetical protein